MPEENVSEKTDRLKNIEDSLSAIRDTQNVIELDMINLKNEIEGLKLVSPSPLPPEAEKRIVELRKFSEDVEIFRKWLQTVDEVKFLRSKIMGIKSAGKPAVPEPPERSEIEEIKKRVAELGRSVLMKPGVKPPETGDLRKAIEENRSIIEDMKARIPREKVSMPRLDELKMIVKENSRSIENLNLMLATKHHTEVIPDVRELKKTIEENRKVVEELRSRISKVKPSGPAGDSRAMDARLSELIDTVEGNRKSIEDLKVRVIKVESKGGAELPERVEDEIEELRNLLYSKLGDLNVKTEGVRTDELKKMITENREALEKLKEGVQATRTKKGMEFPLPLKDRITELEKTVGNLNKKIEGTGLKPIKVPEGMKLPSPERPSKMVAKKIEKLKSNVEDLLKRMKSSEIYMKSLVRKEDMVALERTLRPKALKEEERKMVSENVFKDIENVKKAVVRNEDHVNNLASDIEQLKREISTIEKREWDEVGERPTLEDLARRIEEIEHKVKSMGASSPVFIE